MSQPCHYYFGGRKKIHLNKILSHLKTKSLYVFPISLFFMFSLCTNFICSYLGSESSMRQDKTLETTPPTLPYSVPLLTCRAVVTRVTV